MNTNDDQHLDEKVIELMLELDVLKFNRNSLLYTACYCEENIYMLCSEIKKRKPELLNNFSVMFISNDNRSVSLKQNQTNLF